MIEVVHIPHAVWREMIVRLHYEAITAADRSGSTTQDISRIEVPQGQIAVTVVHMVHMVRMIQGMIRLEGRQILAMSAIGSLSLV